MDRLQEYYRQSLLADLCQEYKGKWASCHDDKEKLFRLAVAQQSFPHMATFAYKGLGLTQEYIKDGFSDFVNGQYTAIDADGVNGDYKTELYVGYNGDLSVSDDVFMTMWSDVPSMEIEATKAVKIYVSCWSDVHIVCGGYNSVVIMLFDESRVTLEDVDEDSSVTIYRYSKDAKVEYGDYCMSKKIKEFEKELKI